MKEENSSERISLTSTGLLVIKNAKRSFTIGEQHFLKDDPQPFYNISYLALFNAIATAGENSEKVLQELTDFIQTVHK